MEDNKIISNIISGKTDDFAILMNKYHNEIFSFVFNIVGQYQDTEDLLQEVFYKVYLSLKKYNPNKASFRTWLYKVTSNHVFNFMKSSQKTMSSFQEVDVSLLKSSEDIELEVIKTEQIDQILMIMKKVLSPKHQRILMLYYFSKLSVKEISEVLKIPDKTIYKALRSSIEKIKKEVTNNA